MEFGYKFYERKKECDEGEDGEDEVGWRRHLVFKPHVTDTQLEY